MVSKKRFPVLVTGALAAASAWAGFSPSSAVAASAPARKAAPSKMIPASRSPQPAPSSTPEPSEPPEPKDEYGPPEPPPGGATPKPRRTPAPTARDLERKDVVREVRVVGNMRISEDRILLMTPVGMGDRVGRSDILDAVQRIYNMGFFADVRPQTEPVLGGIRVVFQVAENPTLRGVRFEGVTKLDPATLEAHFKPLVGDIINFNAVKEAVDKVQKQYADAGYQLARVADMGLAPDGTLLFRIAEGRIAGIKVTGNEETKEHVVLRELTTKPGEIFNGEKMRLDLRRIYNLNFFEDVNLKFEPAPRTEGSTARPGEDIVVVIAVKEKQTGSINLGAGYSTRDGILGMFTVKKDNLFGTGRQVGLDLSISQQLRVAGEVNYFDPWFDPQRTGLGGSLYVRRFNNFLADFREDRMGGSVNVSRPLVGDPLTSQWRGTVGFKAERISTYENVWAGGNLKPRYESGKAITLNPEGTDQAVGGTIGVTFDSRDILINPTEGIFAQFQAEPSLVNGVSPLARGTATGNFFFPMPAMPWAPTERTTIAVGTRLGLIAGAQVPAYERFFSTGPYLVRGWPEFVGLGHPTVQKYGINYFQGSNAFVGSLEYRFPLFNIVSGVIFGDTGIFWDDRFDPTLLHSGYGAGVRLTTPLGPIRLDYGLSGLEPGQFHFSIGQKF